MTTTSSKDKEVMSDKKELLKQKKDTNEKLKALRKAEKEAKEKRRIELGKYDKRSAAEEKEFKSLTAAKNARENRKKAKQANATSSSQTNPVFTEITKVASNAGVRTSMEAKYFLQSYSKEQATVLIEHGAKVLLLFGRKTVDRDLLEKLVVFSEAFAKLKK
jgi:vacuolar-type H+-ATPase subunit I/STV1